MQKSVPGVGSSRVTLDSIKCVQAIGLVYDTIRLATLARDDQGYQDQVGGIMPGASRERGAIPCGVRKALCLAFPHAAPADEAAPAAAGAQS